MSDHALEQLRRRWDDGDLEARVRCLREGVRAGVVAERHVRGLAALGVEAAAHALGEAPVELSLPDAARRLDEELTPEERWSLLMAGVREAFLACRPTLPPDAARLVDALFDPRDNDPRPPTVRLVDTVRELRFLERRESAPGDALSALVAASRALGASDWNLSRFVTDAAGPLLGARQRGAFSQALLHLAWSMAEEEVQGSYLRSLQYHVRLRPAMYVGDTRTYGVATLIRFLLRQSARDAQEGRCRRISFDVSAQPWLVFADDTRGLLTTPEAFRRSLLGDRGGLMISAECVDFLPPLCGRFVAEARDAGRLERVAFDHGLLVRAGSGAGEAALSSARRDGREFRFELDSTIFADPSLSEALPEIACYLRRLACLLAVECRLAVEGGTLVFPPRPFAQLLVPYDPHEALSLARTGRATVEHELRPKRPAFQLSDEGPAGLRRIQVALTSGDTHLPSRPLGDTEPPREAGVRWEGWPQALLNTPAIANWESCPEGGSHALALARAVRASLANWGVPVNVAWAIAVWLDEPCYAGSARWSLNNPEVEQPLFDLLAPALSAWFAAHPEVARACVTTPE
ncbi:MAG: hypothetical protein R3F62_18630 [Planctomycetota bacterium]